MKISRRKSNQENPNKLDKGIIDNWLEEHGDPAIDRLVKKNLAIANKIQEVLKNKGLRAVDLAALMGKQKSEVSKWLSGQHTFTMRTITAIESALECDIINIEPEVNTVYFTTYVRYESNSNEQEGYQFEDSFIKGGFKYANS
ncbi:helix-turn-helix transcriptional regulator [Sphingobacterium shayense]|uniref:helix-turn-helix domain-containing protein n=1 Tax=Sphingobacterium shayense TaxID=626343 RepID=UPI0015528DEE|nr:helix-turn-helix transcriptional regulator [Sphingobacterium shayense]NQD70184.1 helix-turn-helix transcriptional regulator [Sphingobacterium shayense]